MQNRVFQGLAGYQPAEFTLTGEGMTQRISGTRVTANFFSLLGVEPQLGRDFRPEEEQSSATRVVLLSHGFWQRQFGGDPNVLEKAIHLNGFDYTVVGVLPARRAAELDPLAALRCE